MRTTDPISTKLDTYIPQVMLITWLEIWMDFMEKLFWQFFFKKFRCIYLKVKQSIGHNLNVLTVWCEMKGKCIGWILSCELIIYDHDHNLWVITVEWVISDVNMPSTYLFQYSVMRDPVIIITFSLQITNNHDIFVQWCFIQTVYFCSITSNYY